MDDYALNCLLVVVIFGLLGLEMWRARNSDERLPPEKPSEIPPGYEGASTVWPNELSPSTWHQRGWSWDPNTGVWSKDEG